MTKVELVKGLSEKLECTKKEVEEKITFIDKVMEFVKETGEKVKLGKYITAEVVKVEEKSGIAMGKEWHKEAHNELKIKQVKSTKEI